MSDNKELIEEWEEMEQVCLASGDSYGAELARNSIEALEQAQPSDTGSAELVERLEQSKALIDWFTDPNGGDRPQPNKSTLTDASRYLGDAIQAISNQQPEFEPLLAPTKGARDVFRATLQNNPDADMKAIPNQWLLNERAITEQAVENATNDKQSIQGQIAKALMREYNEIQTWQDALKGLDNPTDFAISQERGFHITRLKSFIESALAKIESIEQGE